MTECRSQHSIDLIARFPISHAIAQFALDEAHEERVERSACSEDLLGNRREWLIGRNHRCERVHLAGGALGVSGGGGSAVG